MVLLAGFPESWFAWRKVMPLLAAAHRIIAPDLPGQGDSDRPMGGHCTQSLAASVHGLLQQLGIERYFLAAHDVGAWVAYPCAALFGGEVRRLVLMDAGITECLRVFTKDGGLRAGLAYYRAAALSAQQNRELSARGKLAMPVLALGSDQGSIADMASPLKAFADEVHGKVIANCGHFLPEEQPSAVAGELSAFFGAS